MRERIRPTKTGLFAIELLIAVGVFTFCAAVCMGLFVRAETISRESEALNEAVNLARDLAECFRAAGGDLTETAVRCGGVREDGALVLERDGITLRLEARQEAGYTAGILTAQQGDASLLRWTLAAREAAA